MKRGFTLIEITLAVGILVLIGAIGLVSFLNSRRVRELTTGAENVLSILRLAQARSLAGQDASPWGVRLESSQAVLFRGASFAGATFTEGHPLPASVEVANVNLAGGGIDVIFKRLDGRTDQAGSFEVRVKGASYIFAVTVESSGKVFQTGTAPAETGARLADTRHRAFNLGWSIKTYTTLTFTFSDPPNPDDPRVVTMAPYFNADKSKFDWSGTFTIGGQPQTLRIHTTSLTDTNTILSVDRDCRKNTKKVKITISKTSPSDVRDIATYVADCKTATAEVPYGGTMSEP